MSGLIVRDLFKTFPNGTEVLKGINIDVSEGEFLILVGSSGCGKSTLLNMIAGLETISRGDIFIGGQRVNDLPPKNRDIAMVFQSYALYPSMTVRENISFGLEVRKVAPAQRKIIVDRVAESLQIGHLLDRRPRQLSGGQRQRVAMGRALARNPTLFLFDEPLSNLDAKLRLEMRTEMKMMHRRLGKTICYVTHDQIEAMTLGDKIAVMKDGVILQMGLPSQIYNNPVNRYVAGFIGSPPMNFIPVRIEPMGAGFGIVLDAGAGQKLIPIDISASAAGALSGREVLLGIRPERMSNGDNRDESPRLDVRVELVETTGPDTLVFARVNGARVISRVHPNIVPEVDFVLPLRLDLSSVLLFDPSSGERLAA